MRLWKFTFDKDEEEVWLNDWCQRGWAMTSFFMGVVNFSPCQPGEYIYRIDLVPGQFLRAYDYEGYVIFMDDLGVEVIQRWGRWVYLRKRAEDGPFELYTDIDSKIALYRRIRSMFLFALMIEVMCSVSIWSGVFSSPAVVFYRSLAAIYALIFIVLLRGIWRCSWRIQELNRQRQ